MQSIFSFGRLSNSSSTSASTSATGPKNKDMTKFQNQSFLPCGWCSGFDIRECWSSPGGWTTVPSLLSPSGAYANFSPVSQVTDDNMKLAQAQANARPTTEDDVYKICYENNISCVFVPCGTSAPAWPAEFGSTTAASAERKLAWRKKCLGHSIKRFG